MSKLYVGGLAYSTTEDELKEHFAQFGPVTEASIITDRETGNSRGFGFVTMETSEGAAAAIEGAHGQEFAGRTLTVNEARPRTDR